MLIFAGLGNPGAKYAGNRHNIGFMALDRIAADHGFGPWKARFQGHACEGRLGSAKVLLLKPGTFMNLSGQSVSEAMRFYKLESTDITVFHDEIDLAPGKLRVKDGGGHAGHNGLRSVHQHIGPHYSRVRMGVGHPGRKEAVPGYVLNDFAKADQDWLDDVLRGVSDGAPHLADGDAGRFQNAVAQRTAPARSSTRPSAGTQPGGGDKPKPSAPAAQPAPQAEGAPATPDNRSALQKLADRFR
ncbi:aminoacyl-tRNA hydrolase [Roseovarius sp. M141]|uniref:aminoacyl-tRNA hydrolase n=1 Tax=Roseovarius sp. M141 TaxID=2583806 RepID=UPI0020CF3B98|nr:aminoacyl-tRNA hydrolase [Roseovarius sp. M141]MCQ0094161.1 aminoacyl-tRNA hydrolase [Roseovarius sp. M141]